MKKLTVSIIGVELAISIFNEIRINLLNFSGVAVEPTALIFGREYGLQDTRTTSRFREKFQGNTVRFGVAIEVIKLSEVTVRIEVHVLKLVEI